MDYVIIIFRTIFFYFILLVVYRLMGKREVGQLGMIDLIISILISQLAAIGIEKFDGSILISLVPIFMLLFLQKALAILSLKVPKTREFLDGKPSVIIKGGKINFKEMSKQKYNLDDILMQLREDSVSNLEEIEYAILETSGNLSIFRKKDKKTDYPFAIILDGVIQDNVLKEINKDKNWIDKLLIKKNVELKDVFYAFYKGDRTYIIKRSDIT